MAPQNCPKCGKPIEAGTPGGACPSCMMAMAIPGHTNGQTTPFIPGTYAPDPSELTGYFANLELVELLGHGGMGAVYKARQINLDRIVALKIMSPRLMADPSFAERFTREARTLAKLNHPNIVTVYDFGHEVGPQGDLHYLVMELIEGVNLRAAIANKTITPEQALAIVPKVCEALQYAHDQGIVHRDIKPENILIGKNSQVKIADFGLAKILERPDTELTLTGTHQVLGTRNYMAPEQIEKPTTVDHRADIYSLGVVFYELLTGELPLGRFSLPSEKAFITQQLDDVVLKTLEKEPAARYQQASQVKTAVEQIENVQPDPTATPEPSIEEKPASTDSAQPNNPKSKFDRLSLPFIGEEIHAGFSELNGIAHFDGKSFELEYQTSLLGLKKMKRGTANVPAEKILRANFQTGTFHDSIEVQCGDIAAFEDVPSAKQGKVRLYTEKKFADLARQFTAALNGQAPSFITPEKPPKIDIDSALAHLPFAIEGINDGFSDAYGIAKVTDDAIELQYEVQDGFGISKSATKTSTIPFAQIIKFDYRKGIFNDKFEIQTNSIESVDEIPSSSRGRVKFTSKKADRELARHFALASCRAAGVKIPEAAMPKKPLTPDQETIQTMNRRLRWPALGLLIVAALNMAYVGLYFSFVVLNHVPMMQNEQRSMVSQFWHDNVTSTFEDNAILEFISSFILNAGLEQPGSFFSLASCAMSILVIVISLTAFVKIKNLKSRSLILAIACLIALPLNVGFLVSLPVGIWLIAILIDPESEQGFQISAADSDLDSNTQQLKTYRIIQLAIFMFTAINIIMFVTLATAAWNFGDLPDSQISETVDNSQKSKLGTVGEKQETTESSSKAESDSNSATASESNSETSPNMLSPSVSISTIGLFFVVAVGIVLMVLTSIILIIVMTRRRKLESV